MACFGGTPRACRRRRGAKREIGRCPSRRLKATSPLGHQPGYPLRQRTRTSRPGTSQGSLIANLVVVPDPAHHADPFRGPTAPAAGPIDARALASHPHLRPLLRFPPVASGIPVDQRLIWFTGIPDARAAGLGRSFRRRSSARAGWFWVHPHLVGARIPVVWFANPLDPAFELAGLW